MDDEVWITRDGQAIEVGDMDMSHVRNTLRMIWRRDAQEDDVLRMDDRQARDALRQYIRHCDEARAILEDHRFDALGWGGGPQ